MKKLLTTLFLCALVFNTFGAELTPKSGWNNDKKDRKKEKANKASESRNIHSIKKWKITVEYLNGNVISKTIVVRKNSGVSAIDAAFEEAEKYLGNIKNVKEYSVSPVPSSYVVLAGD